LGARLPNAPMSLESCDVGLTFHLNMLEFMDSMNQELQVDKEMRADKTKWLSPYNTRCSVFFLNKKVGQGTHAKYFIGAWQGM
jgi:hypothetical protein